MDARPIPNDATLVWLASERAAPLYRTLDRTRAFGPLVVLLAVLPPVLATFAETITPEDAAWGLRALEITGSNLPSQAAAAAETIVPTEKIRPAALQLSATLLRVTDPARPGSGSLASLLGGVILLGLLWPLAKRLGGRRFAFWSVLLAAFHPTLTTLLLHPVPVTTALALAIAALWGHLNLDGKPLRAWLAGLVEAGSIAGGLLLIGPAAAVVPVVGLADAGFAVVLSLRDPTEPRTGRGIAGVGVTAVRRIVVLLVGVVLWAFVEFVFLNGTLAATESDGERLEPAIDVAEAVIVGPLWGLAAIGLGRMVRILHRKAALRGPRTVPRMLLVWFIVAGALALAVGEPADLGFDPANRYVLAIAGLPLLLTAAYAIEEAAQRMVSGAWVLLAAALPLAVRVGGLMAMASSGSPVAWILIGIVAAGAAWFVTRTMPNAVTLPGLRRGLLMGAILLVIAVNAYDGLVGLFPPARSDDAYRRLAGQLVNEPFPDAVALLAKESPPIELTYAMRASFPQAAMEMAATWDEAIARLERRLGQPPRRTIAAAWGMRDAIGASRAEDLKPTGEPLLFGGRELLLYVAGGHGTRTTDRLPGPEKTP